MIASAIARTLDAAIESLEYRPDSAGGNTFVDWMPDSPDVAVAVMAQPATPNLTKLPGDSGQVQVLIRHTDPDGLSRLATSIFDALACLPAQILAAGTPDEVQLIGCTATTSGPIGRDEAGRPEWSLDVSLRFHNPTTHRPAVTA